MIGVSAYKLTHSLSRQIKSQLPTIEELKKELSGEELKWGARYNH
jgi:hypothetical protein